MLGFIAIVVAWPISSVCQSLPLVVLQLMVSYHTISVPSPRNARGHHSQYLIWLNVMPSRSGIYCFRSVVVGAVCSKTTGFVMSFQTEGAVSEGDDSEVLDGIYAFLARLGVGGG